MYSSKLICATKLTPRTHHHLPTLPPTLTTRPRTITSLLPRPPRTSTHSTPRGFFNNAQAAPKARTSEEKLASDPAMFCFQCEQTSDASGCTTVGVCGKTPRVAAHQDFLLYQLKVLSFYLHQIRALGGAEDASANDFTLRALFSTLTNVNFDETRFHGEFCLTAAQHIAHAKSVYDALAPPPPTTFTRAFIADALHPTPIRPETFLNPTDLIAKAHAIGLVQRMHACSAKDAMALGELLTYGIKGLAAYAEHAAILDHRDPIVIAFVHEALAFLSSEAATHDIDTLLTYALRVGEVNLRVMSMLERAATERYGAPQPTRVRTTPRRGKAILVSGHDLRDLERVLNATMGRDVNVYTHGELLPAHSYPALKSKYPQLVGNWGGAWQNQKSDFAAFPGAIVMTTNCLIEPRKSYATRLFTSSVTGWPGVRHLREERDFEEVVTCALGLKGFEEEEVEERALITGYGKHTILANAGKIVEAINAGAIKRFFVIGGCDGAEAERNYFGDLAASLPRDAMVLTLGCGKYRFNSKELGSIGEFPRVLDMGQCNDAIGAVEVAVALANVYKTDVNSLPLSFAISWFEQKAVAVLLSLLHLGIRNIRLGPNLPAFIPPSTLNLLVEKFNIAPVGDVKIDLANMMQGK